MSTSESKNYYELLGLTPEATAEQIKDAYKDIAKIYHPDSHFYDEIIQDKTQSDADRKFRELTAAYNTLINPEKRAAYDELIPRGLRSWDDESEEAFTATIRPAAGKKAGPAYGVFGVIKEDEPEPSVERSNPSRGGFLKWALSLLWR